MYIILLSCITVQRFKSFFMPWTMCLGSTVTSVMDSHSYDQGSKSQTLQIRHAPNNIQFISDESSFDLVLYLCE